MVNNETTVAQLIEMGITLEAIKNLLAKEQRRSQRNKAKAEKEAEMQIISAQVLEALNADPAKKWKTGQLVASLFGLKKSADEEMEKKRYRVHGMISQTLSKMSESGNISKISSGNACHTWYQSTLPIPEPTFSVNTSLEVAEEIVEELQIPEGVSVAEIVFDAMEEKLQEEEDLQDAIEEIISND